MGPIIALIAGGILTLYGIFIQVRKKVFVSKFTEQILMLFIIISPSVNSNSWNDPIFFGLIFLCLSLFLRYRYTLHNISRKQVLEMLVQILKEKGIEHAAGEDRIYITEGQQLIHVKEAKKDVMLNFTEAKSICPDLIQPLKESYKEAPSITGYTGLWIAVLGCIFIGTVFYLSYLR